MTSDEERIALFLDYENLAIGARDDLGGMQFDLRPLADALAERGRTLVRRAYADWSYFDPDRRALTQQHVELIEIPQRMGKVRKNAADIKMAVDAVEMCFARSYITTFVICTGDSDFTPLVDKLRSLNKHVIGVGLRASTSALLPPACDEFLFYERLEGVSVPERPVGRPPGRGRGGRGGGRGRGRDEAPAPMLDQTVAEREPSLEPELEEPEPEQMVEREEVVDEKKPADPDALVKLVTQTLAGLQSAGGGAVLASQLKRAMLRKDPTFSESEYGFRSFGELLRHLADRKVVDLSQGAAKGDPEVGFPEESSGEEGAFALLVDVVRERASSGTPPPLSGLKNELRRRRQDFSEKAFGFSSFLQFCKAARARGVLRMEWDDEADDYVLSPAPPASG